MYRLVKYLLIPVSILVLVGCKEEVPIKSWQNDYRGLYAADFADNGGVILVSTVDNSAQLWSTKSQALVFKWSHNKGGLSDIAHAVISTNGKIAITSDDFNIVVWNARTGKSLGFWKMPSRIASIKITEDGKYALIGYANRSIQLVDLKDGRSVWQVNLNGYIQCISISEDGKFAAAGDDDGFLSVWDIENSKLLFNKEMSSRPRFIKISNKNNMILVSSSLQPIKILNLQTGELIKNLTKYKGFLKKFSRAYYNVISAEFSESDDMVLIGAPPRNLYLWSIETGAIIQKWSMPIQKTWKPTSSLIYAVAFGEDEKTVYSESSDGYGYQWLINIGN